MKSISKTIVFFGTEDFSADVLNHLIKSGYPIEFIVTKPDSKSGRGQKIQFSKVKQLAIKYNIKLLQPTNIKDINQRLLPFADNLIGILVSFGKILPKSTLDLFHNGIINIHPSLLPKYRGPSPIESAIYNGDKTTGVSIMKINDRMDAGPIYKTVEYNLKDDDNQETLYKKLAKLGSEELIKILPKILDGSLKPNKQNENEATYCSMLTKAMADLRPKEYSAAQAERKIRAHIKFPKTRFTILNHDVIITKAHVSQNSESLIDIKCNDDNYLVIDNLLINGKNMTAQDFINGYNK